MNENREKYYLLTKNTVWGLLVYYILLLLVSLVVLVVVIKNVFSLQKNEVLIFSVYASLASSTMFCCVWYIRKIYKALINSQISAPASAEYEAIGVMIYFACRPLFALAFSLISIFALLAGMIIITTSVEYVLNARFIYVCVLVSSIIGFSVGDVLDRFQKFSKKKVDETFDRK